MAGSVFGGTSLRPIFDAAGSHPARLPDVTCHDRWSVAVAYRVATATPCAAFAMSAATAFGCDTYTA
jgi:hypothetical protein